MKLFKNILGLKGYCDFFIQLLVVNVASEASRRHGVLKLPEDLMDTTPFTARVSSPIYRKPPAPVCYSGGVHTG